MSHFPDHGINDPDIASLRPQDLPSSEALLAGTLALMTGFSQGNCCEMHRDLIARKIIANLSMLSGHPAPSTVFKAMAGNLQALWVQLLRKRQALNPASLDMPDSVRQHPASPPVLWHTLPEAVQ